MNKTTTALLVFILFFICLIPAYRAGSHTEGKEAILSSEQVIEALTRHGFELKKDPRNPGTSDVFHRVINGVVPEIYTFDSSVTFVLYVFQSHRDLEQGRNAFYNIPATLVKHEAFEIHNVWLIAIGLQERTAIEIRRLVQEQELLQ